MSTPVLDFGLYDTQSGIVLRENNDEFLEGYIALVDGEKDPRNLMLTFSMDRVLCIEFDIDRCIEVSTTTSCYIRSH